MSGIEEYSVEESIELNISFSCSGCKKELDMDEIDQVLAVDQVVICTSCGAEYLCKVVVFTDITIHKTLGAREEEIDENQLSLF